MSCSAGVFGKGNVITRLSRRCHAPVRVYTCGQIRDRMGGEIPIIPTGGWTDALGVIHLTYRSDPGLISLLSPKGLTASGVTPALLADLHLSAQGSVTSATVRSFAARAAVLARNQQPAEFCWSKPDMSELATLRAGNGVLKNSTYDYPGGIWGGYAKTEAEDHNSINAAAGDWQVPSSGTKKKSPSAESTWVGVGGLGGSSGVAGLIQTGTSMMTGRAYQTWWEYIGTSGCTDYTSFCGKYSAPDSAASTRLPTRYARAMASRPTCNGNRRPRRASSSPT
jgi:hypothetical protein